jgi:hypothetical protein
MVHFFVLISGTAIVAHGHNYSDARRSEPPRGAHEGGAVKIYRVIRNEDVSGVSGCGHVADLVEFDDGAVVVRWRTVPIASTVLYASLADALLIHGHDGRTTFEQLADLPEAKEEEPCANQWQTTWGDTYKKAQALQSENDQLRAQLAQTIATLRLAQEWAALYPREGFGSSADQTAANQVYEACERALVDLPEAQEKDHDAS